MVEWFVKDKHKGAWPDTYIGCGYRWISKPKIGLGFVSKGDATRRLRLARTNFADDPENFGPFVLVRVGKP